MPTNKEKIGQIFAIIAEKYNLKDNIMAAQGMEMVKGWLAKQNEADLGEVIAKIKAILNS